MSKNRYASVAALASALTVALASCASPPGADDDVNGASSGTPASSSATTTSGAATSGGDGNAAQNAIETAQSEVGGTATDIDFNDDNQWDVTVVDNGKATEVILDANGGNILHQEGSEPLDSEDQKEFDSAQTTLADALTTATDEHPGNINDAELTTHNNTAIYDIDLYAGANNSQVTVRVNATSGDIVTTI